MTRCCVHLQTGVSLPQQSELMRRAYEELLQPYFSPEDLDPLSEFEMMLGNAHIVDNPVLPGTFSCFLTFHVFIYLELDVKDAANMDEILAELEKIDINSCTLYGVATCEHYENSNTCLLGYLAVSSSCRRQGIATLLCSMVANSMASTAAKKNASPPPLLLECHRAGVEDGIMNSAQRLQTYHAMGFVCIDPNFPFIVPSLEPDLDPAPGYMLLVHSSFIGDGSQQAIESSIVMGFVLEYYAGAYTPAEKLDEAINPMLEWFDNHPQARIESITALLTPKVDDVVEGDTLTEDNAKEEE
eukprot:m.2470 g.2470  ORF g.2470 m.2470 type:complete len:300 (+) comp1799_c0_seq1:87-986(+)